MFWHCSEEIHDNAVTFGVKHKKPQIKYLKGAEAKLVMNQLEKKVSKSKLRILGKAGTYARSNEGTIDYSEIMQVIDTLGNTNYTFRIINHPDDSNLVYHNLVVKMSDEDDVKINLLKYTNIYFQESNIFNNQQIESNILITSLSSNDCDPLPIIVNPIQTPNPIGGGGSDAGGGYTGGGSFGGGSTGGTGSNGSINEIATPVFQCNSCSFNANSWDDFKVHTDENGVVYSFTVNLKRQTNSNTTNSGLQTDPCLPDGDIGVLLPDEDCNTTPEDLKNAFPNISQVKAEQLSNLINENGHKFGINNKFKLRHFLSQIAHESGGLNNFQRSENLNYSSAGLLKTFPKYFSLTNPNLPNPINYANNPQLIANYVYADRMGNGNVQSGDGYKYRGRGLIQITGKDNYTKFNDFYNSNYEPSINFIDNPELIISNDEISIISAMWFFSENVINKTELKNNNDETVLKVTKKINGGRKVLSERTNNHSNCVTNIDCK